MHRAILAIAVVFPFVGFVKSSVPSCSSPPCLFFSTSSRIKSLSLSNPSSSTTVIKSLSNANALAIDVKERLLFWSETQAIKSFNLISGQTKTIQYRPNSQVRGLAVDWESSLLYFTDYFYEEIGIVTYDGKRNKTLITAGVANPHGIAVDPSSGRGIKGCFHWKHRPICQSTASEDQIQDGGPSQVQNTEGRGFKALPDV